jgi:hypothetical protein
MELVVCEENVIRNIWEASANLSYWMLKNDLFQNE